MIIVNDPHPDYNGMYGLTHVCNRCNTPFAFGDTRKIPKDLDKVEICPDCALEMFNVEHGRLNMASMEILRKRYHTMQETLVEIGKRVCKHNDDFSILKETPCPRHIEMVYYWSVDGDHGASFSVNIPYHLLHKDETWEERLQKFVDSKPDVKREGNV